MSLPEPPTPLKGLQETVAKAPLFSTHSFLPPDNHSAPHFTTYTAGCSPPRYEACWTLQKQYSVEFFYRVTTAKCFQCHCPISIFTGQHNPIGSYIRSTLQRQNIPFSTTSNNLKHHLLDIGEHVGLKGNLNASKFSCLWAGKTILHHYLNGIYLSHANITVGKSG